MEYPEAAREDTGSAELRRVRDEIRGTERFHTVAIWSAVTCLVFATLAVFDLARGKVGIATLEAGGALLAGVATLTPRDSPRRKLFRWLGPTYVFAAFCVAYWTTDVRGAAVMWIFIVPLGLFHLLGSRNGLLASLPFAALTALWLWGPESLTRQILPVEYRVRATATFVVLVLVSGLLARVREQTRRRLRRATERIKLLEGMLPICAGCKKIREGDDWRPVDAYIAEKTEAVFSHGLCPDCEVIWSEVE